MIANSKLCMLDNVLEQQIGENSAGLQVRFASWHDSILDRNEEFSKASWLSDAT